jgi:predicted SAM-dependent methyltransferase
MAVGGVIRVVIPDLAIWANAYINSDAHFFRRYRQLYLGGDGSVAMTNSDVFMTQMHGWEHKWCYDYESIQKLMLRSGFLNVKRQRVLESAIPLIAQFESSSEGRVMESMYVEATKG